ncbi:CvpA family protein [Rhodopseudomonas boonkerdii]|uniref:CvpA family protein n=1 Tax=Rhodopseudomonas boonkerdii TaxID=475937 RepID=UPI001E385539|nr:CvpA family protein [Rhodopseudomonas boonkerdii]UGV28387.1 CvpA family protein [Rhodopseudomonas boonkerdii]
MNSFDIVVYIALLIAIALGFCSGLLRSAVTILGYLLAAPIAVWITGLILPPASASQVQNSLIFFAIFLIAGMVLGSLLRLAINDLIGTHIGIGDRLGGAALGAIRVGLIAVTLVLIFDQLVPANMQPSYLAGSHLRPLLSRLGQAGIRTLPADLAARFDQLKRSRNPRAG